MEIDEPNNSPQRGWRGACRRFRRIVGMIPNRVLQVALVVAVLAVIVGICIFLIDRGNVMHSVVVLDEDMSVEKKDWFDIGLDELKYALNVKKNTRRAKNVILFVGDGMGVNTVTASRIYEHGESGRLSWETFPHTGMLKTYCFDRQVTDSAAAATALFGGVKANYETAGVDSFASVGGWPTKLDAKHHVHSILAWAQNAQMATGFVTTTRVTHATPAALYAHSTDRRWECESNMNPMSRHLGSKDIARQLVEERPGRDLNVIMGGGRQCLISNVTGTDGDPVEPWACYSRDGRDLMSEWYRRKERSGRAIATNNEQLAAVDTSKTNDLMGIFANGHMTYDHERDHGQYGMPSLTNMTDKAIRVLKRNPNGFMLVVEGGLIDQAHHRGWARRALSETVAMDNAIKSALAIMKDEMDDTLIIVTADHSHTLSINGYPKRRSDILNVAQKSKADQVPYTTLTYATGGPLGYQVDVDAAGKPSRRDPTKSNIFAYDYVQQVGIMTDENTHGGGDVSIHAIGPSAHLFHSVHEQSYVAHVIAYAARIGRFREMNWFEKLLNFLGM